MECHPWFEVSDRRKIRFRNVQIKVLLVFEQGRPLLVLTSFDQFWQFLTSFKQFWPVLTSLYPRYNSIWYNTIMALYIFPRGVITVADQCGSWSIWKKGFLRKMKERGTLHTYFGSSNVEIYISNPLLLQLLYWKFKKLSRFWQWIQDLNSRQ